jgi:hypothetical protein
MKYIQFLLLTASLIAVTAHAETIDSDYEVLTNPKVPVGTNTKVCMKKAFIKRNAGTLITGLATANIKPYAAVEKALNTTTGTYTTKNVTFTYSLAASTAPVQAGVYDLCFTPSGFLWKSGTYSIKAVVKGTTASDNGLFEVTLTGGNF